MKKPFARWLDPQKPRKFVQDKNCKQKSRFTDEPQARAAALVALEHPRPYEKQPKTVLWVYRCKHCSGWHMTSSDCGPRYRVELERKAA